MYTLALKDPVCSAVGMWIYCLNTRQLGCCHSRGETQLNLFHVIFTVHHSGVTVRRCLLEQLQHVCGTNLADLPGDFNWRPSNEGDEPLLRQRGKLNSCVRKSQSVSSRHCVHTLRVSRMIHSRFFFAQGRSLHQRAAHWDPKRGPLPSAPPVQEQALHPHSGEAQMGQVQAHLQVFTLLQMSAWAGTCKRRPFQTIGSLTVVK